jgi:hypothetical protein
MESIVRCFFFIYNQKLILFSKYRENGRETVTSVQKYLLLVLLFRDFLL